MGVEDDIRRAVRDGVQEVVDRENRKRINRELYGSDDPHFHFPTEADKRRWETLAELRAKYGQNFSDNELWKKHCYDSCIRYLKAYFEVKNASDEELFAKLENHLEKRGSRKKSAVPITIARILVSFAAIIYGFKTGIGFWVLLPALLLVFFLSAFLVVMQGKDRSEDLFGSGV